MKPAKYEVGQLVDVRRPERQASDVEIVGAQLWAAGQGLMDASGDIFYQDKDYWLYELSDDFCEIEPNVYPHNPPAADSWKALHKQLIVESWAHQAKELVKSD